RPARARRTPVSPRCSCAPAPDDDAAAEAQPACGDVLESGVAPGREQARERPALVEAADAVAEEPSDLVPARRDRAPEERQPDADVEVPRHARRGPGRDAEVELRGRCARAQDPRELAQAGREGVQIAEEVGAGQAVERPGP